MQGVSYRAAAPERLLKRSEKAFPGLLAHSRDFLVLALSGMLILLAAERRYTMPKFMNYQDRLAIEKGLSEQKSFGQIGQEIGKDRTTIAKEIKKYSSEKKSGYSAYPYNACKKRSICKLKMICGKESCTHQSVHKCSLCSSCNDFCAEFEEEVCTVIQKPPYVCNGCSSLGKCTLKKNIYDAAGAHTRFPAAISESRSGILSNELARLMR